MTKLSITENNIGIVDSMCALDTRLVVVNDTRRFHGLELDKEHSFMSLENGCFCLAVGVSRRSAIKQAPMFRPVRSPPLFEDPVEHVSAEFDQTLLEAVTEFEQQELDSTLSRAVDKRRAEFLAGRRCARAALSRTWPEHAGAGLEPGAQRAPAWPDGVVGSITHTAGFAAAAVAPGERVIGLGLDTEQILSEARAQSIRRSVASPDEVELAALSASISEPLALTLLFSAKESIYKCLYPAIRRYFGLLEAHLVELDRSERTCVLELNPQISELWGQSRLRVRFSIEPPYVHTGISVARGQR